MPRYRSYLAGLLALILIAVPLHAGFAQDDAPAANAVVTDELLAEFETIITAAMDTFHIPGAAVAVIQDGAVVYTQGFGVRSVATGEPFTPQTQFRIGSTTKSMTSLMIAQLVDEGVLAWDTPVTDIYPDYTTSDPDLTAKLTVADLMSMGTGLENDGLESLRWGEWTEADLFQAIAAMPVAGEYRQHYYYNNEVYASAGYLAALAAGEPMTLDAYTQLMQRRVFDAIGLPATLITDDRGDLSDNHADSYSFNLIDGVTVPDPVLPAPIHVVAPAGAVWSTLEDMSRYVITQINGGVTPEGARIVSAENLAVTWEPQVAVPNQEPEISDLGYAMGWVVETYNGTPIRFHDGGWDGYRTMMVVFPETQTGLVVFCNHIVGDLFDYALMYAFADLLSGADPAPVLDQFHTAYDQNFAAIDAQLAFLPAPEVDPAAVSALIGAYEQGWEIALREDNILLLRRPNWEIILRPLPMQDNTYLVASGAALGASVQFDVGNDPVTMIVDAGVEVLTLAKVQ